MLPVLSTMVVHEAASASVGAPPTPKRAPPASIVPVSRRCLKPASIRPPPVAPPTSIAPPIQLIIWLAQFSVNHILEISYAEKSRRTLGASRPFYWQAYGSDRSTV